MTENLYVTAEAEDIMFDQNIISLNVEIENRSDSGIVEPYSRLRVLVTIISQAILPAFVKIYCIYSRQKEVVVHNLRDRLLPAVAAFIVNSVSKSLPSVQRGVIYSLNNTEINESDESTPDCDETPEKSIEVEVLYTPSVDEIEGEVIFIHGLHGGLCKTWKQGMWRHDGHKLKNQFPVQNEGTGDFYVPPKRKSLMSVLALSKQKYSTAIKENIDCDCELINSNCDIKNYSDCWPRDWIPIDFPRVRVIAINYDTDVLWCPVWQKQRNRTGMVLRSHEIIEDLLKIGVGKNPITWVGHSKGGLYIKQIILNAFESNNDQVKSIYQQSKSILFYSVPHKGSILADFNLPFLRRSIELIEIQRNCDFVLDLHKRFLQLYHREDSDLEIFSFIETSFTLMSFIYLKIVAYESADPNMGKKCDVPLDHREICKPAGRDCFLYKELIHLIRNALNR